jgi:enoyl-CoA hydratase/carnithine racemase
VQTAALALEDHDDVTVLRVQAGKGNALSPDLVADLERVLGELPTRGCAAVVVTGHERFFSAGLALPALVDLDRAGMGTFMDRFASMMLRLFTLPLPAVAAINGHAIAGGCVLALQCDARVMAAGELRIGLNEVQLGIGLPASALEPMRLWVPASSWATIALEGRLVDPESARRLGLVDEVVPADEVLPRALVRARELASGARPAYAQIKLALRREALATMQREAATDREHWLDTWFSPSAQQRLREAVAKLRR